MDIRNISSIFLYKKFLTEQKENLIMKNTFDSVLLGVPESTATLQLPDPMLRDYYRDEAERVYWIDGPIDDSTLDLIKTIIRCNKEDKGKPTEERQPITVMIDSPGGSVEVLLTIIKAIKISKTPIRTVCYCTAFSAAADLLACGHQGLRCALPGSSVMMHSGSAAYSGTQSQVDAAKKFYDNMGKRVTDHVYSVTNIDTKTAKKMKDDYYMTEEDALRLGIIDRIIEDFDEII
jgi:ATP-dependent Clp protease protease subunit